LRQAEAVGAIVRTGQTVRRLSHGGRQWHIQADTAMTAETVFLATGKHDLRDLPRSHTAPDAVGMKMYLALSPAPTQTLTGATELTLFPGGYAGMQFVENRRAVLCIAVRGTIFRAHGSWTRLIAAIERNSPRFAAMLTGAQSLLPRPLAVAAIPYGYQAPPGDLFRLGDQAAVIPSLTGDGMAIALHSGQQAAATWLDGMNSRTYQGSLRRTLAPQMRLASLLHHAGMNSIAQAAVMPLIQACPGLLGYAARQTRVRGSAERQTTATPVRPMPETAG
jgi:flavin-dependent dehydrogenase